MIISESIRNKLVSSSRKMKILLMMLNDFVCFLSPFFLSYAIFYFSDESTPIWSLISNISFLIVLIFIFTCIALIFTLNGYRHFFRFSNENLLTVWSNPRLNVLFLYFLAILTYLLPRANLINSLSAALAIILITFASIVFSRSLVYQLIKSSPKKNYLPVIIYGAGQAGRELAAYMGQNDFYKIIGFIDDNQKLKNFKLLNHKIYGDIEQISKIKKKYPKLLVIISIINIKPAQRRAIISNLEKFNIAVKTIPEGYGSLTSKMSIQNLDAKDLLNREEVPTDKKLLKEQIKNKNILISGAGGSIGSEISQKIISLKPNKIIFIDFSEFNLFALKNKLDSFIKVDKTFKLLNLNNLDRIEKIIKEENINIIYHAAAYKHVPMLESEDNLNAALENNFFVTFNLCKLAFENNVDKFTLVSTDKAVNPTNIMGASKRLAELSLQAFQDEPNNKTKFSMVRFGNVLNSSGSVVPLFWEQINSGGPVTVTHEKINRFFMTIEEAANLVIESSSISEGGEVFLLDMGDPIEIKYLAEKMIRLSGNSVCDSDNKNGIEINYSGLRPGEKLYEELLLNNDPQDTIHPKIKKGTEKKFHLSEIQDLKKSLIALGNKQNKDRSISLISKYVDGFRRN